MVSASNTVHWSNDDVSEAISLHAAGPKLYRLLRSKGLPLPGESTLRRWVSNVKIVPGKIGLSFELLKHISLDPVDRVCVLIADEMKVRECYEYDRATDTLIEPSATVQVVVVSGLFINWHQPIYFGFNTDLTIELIFDLMKELHNIDFEVRALNFDLGPKNRSIISSLGPVFINPFDNQRTFVFADSPHLVKLMRNHVVDNGIVTKEGHLVDKQPLVKLMELTKKDSVKITYKVTEESLLVKGFGKQKVKLAAQLLSRTNSAALQRTVSLGLVDEAEKEKWLVVADVFELTNDWFDVFNSSKPRRDNRERLWGFGLSLDVQEEILQRSIAFFESMNCRVKNRSGHFSLASMAPFQKGIIMNCKALPLLFKDMEQKYGIEYILTRRLNQDYLEALFGQIRAMGFLHNHPSPLEFCSRLRKYLLGKNKKILSMSSNVELDYDLINNKENIAMTNQTSNEQEPSIQLPLTAELFSSIQCEEQEDDEDVESEEIVIFKTTVCNMLQLRKSEDLGSPSSEQSCSTDKLTWVDFLSEGGLYKPHTWVLNSVKLLHEVFIKQNGDSLSPGANYIGRMLDASCHVRGSTNMKSLFFRCVMYFKIRQLTKHGVMTKSRNGCNQKMKKMTT
uniref:Transposable element P transposase n=1 Tax=Megaselia scalaris TaxID=36166 RepID=T1GGK3_MEGSC